MNFKIAAAWLQYRVKYVNDQNELITCIPVRVMDDD